MPRFKQRLKQAETEEVFKESNASLKEQFTEEEKIEVKVERKPVAVLILIWNKITLVIGCLFAALGLFSLIQPDLRRCLLELFLQFFTEIGFL